MMVSMFLLVNICGYDYGICMALSKLKTPLSILRKAIGTHHFGQQEKFAKMCGLGVSTVKFLSAGNRPMTRSLAEKISAATGANPDWLMGLPGHQSLNGGKYTRAVFDAWRHQVAKGEVDDEGNTQDIAILLTRIAGIARAASGKGMAGALAVRLESFVKEQCKDLPAPQSIDESLQLKIMFALRGDD